MKIFTFALLAILLGMKHGVDGDHVAAIADMVGSEDKKRKQISLGVMYAVGHGAIVFLIGLISIYLGLEMSDSTREVMEGLVSVTLIILGGFMIFSLFRQKGDYEYKSRVQIIFHFFEKLIQRTNFKKGKNLSSLKIGIFSAAIIGTIHGIGVESPTQIAVLTNVSGGHSLETATVRLSLFVIGLLISTMLIAILLTWGFLKARLKKNLFLVLGFVTGIYSLGLGISMLVVIIKGGV